MEPTRVLLRLSNQKIKRLASALPPQADPAVPDPLLRATLRAALRVANGEIPPVEVMSAGANGLVRDAMQALACKRWHVT